VITAKIYSDVTTGIQVLKHKRTFCIPLPCLSLWLGCFCITISYLLLICIERENYAFRTVSIGFLALLAFSFHLLVRNALHDPFHPDILLTVGHLVQFVIPSVIFATGFLDGDIYPHIRQVRPYFPEMLFAVLFAQTLFNIPFCTVRPHRAIIREKPKKNWSFFIILIAVGVWACRFFIVLTKSYFHSGSSDFMSTSTFYSPLAIFDRLGSIVVAYAALRIFGAGGVCRAIFPKLYITVEIAWHLFSGKREGLFITLLCVILSYILVRRKIPAHYLLVFFFVLFVGVPFLQYFRESTRTQSDYGEISIMEAAKEALVQQKQSNVRNTLNIVLDRLNDGQFAAGCFKAVPESIPYFYGKTYKMIFWILVPRVMYSGRPQFTVSYDSLIRPWITGTSAPVTTIGEAYINFGWFGISLVFFLLGFIYKFMDSIFKPRLSYAEAAILIFFCILVIRMTVCPVVSHLSWMVKVIILLVSYQILNTVRFKRLSLNRSMKKI
jgi:hypothetical protein